MPNGVPKMAERRKCVILWISNIRCQIVQTASLPRSPAFVIVCVPAREISAIFFAKSPHRLNYYRPRSWVAEPARRTIYQAQKIRAGASNAQARYRFARDAAQTRTTNALRLTTQFIKELLSSKAST